MAAKKAAKKKAPKKKKPPVPKKPHKPGKNTQSQLDKMGTY